jgi:hypothetical protein
MAIAWFIVPYKRALDVPMARYCAIDDQTPQIYAEGGAWTEAEVLGNRALVKVRASDATLATLASLYTRIPLARLSDPLSSLTPAQRSALRNRLLDLGYTDAEIRAALPDLNTRTLHDFLAFAATRRRKPRWDAEAGEIILDGPVQSCRPVLSVEAEITE